jgi:pimeloyl-ACP methyl ester carboxylesterase
MKKVFFGALALLLVSLLAAVAAATTPAENTLRISAALACADRLVAECQVLQVSREQLPKQIAYYKALVKIGPGDFDIIAIHRLVREPQVNIPVHTVGSFFFIHGSSADFRLMMLTLNAGLGVFLAQHNIDVWGIDLRNVQIPADAGDLSFGRDWGLDVQIKDVLLATRTARWARVLTGQDSGGLILGGHSSGAALTFAVANTEAVLPQDKRDIIGIVPVDMVYKLSPDAKDQSDFSCWAETTYRDLVASGLFFFDNFANFEMGRLARTDPNGISPYQPPLTNLQFLMENAGALWSWPLYPTHAFAVVRDNSGIAYKGRYSTFGDIDAAYEAVPSYAIPNTMNADMFGVSCPTTDSPYDDNLADIQVPVLYIGAAGGFGKMAEYTTQLLGSFDKTIIMMQALPDSEAQNDVGHMEPFTASQSRRLIWQPLHSWIIGHSH